AEPRWWRGFPIVDSQRSIALLLLATFNDIFLMTLLFLVSGLFVWPSWRRRGTWGFLRRRLVRLGVPFLVAATLLTPLAYVPSYLVTSGERGVAGFLDAWLAMGLFPGAAGPAWFLWVLLAFDTVAAALLALVPGSREWLGRTVVRARDHPAAFFGLLVAVSAVAYLPLALAV